MNAKELKKLNEKRLKKLTAYGKMCEEELAVIGLALPKPIKYEITNRTTKCWGKCVTYYKWDYTIIRVSGWLLDDEIPEKTLHQHVLHELCHAVDNNIHGHKGKWLEYAELISDCYNVDIKRLVTSEQHNSVTNTETYKQNVVAKRRKVGYNWEYHCPKCGGKAKDKRRPSDLAYYPLTREVNYVCSKCKCRLILDKHGDMSKVEYR
jgi:predicted SprT family Zn-dependent metalloprotease